MQALKSVDPASATGKTKQIFDGLQKNLGAVPNLMRTLANSPAALNAYISFNAALSEGSLPAKLREQLAIAVAEVVRKRGLVAVSEVETLRSAGFTDGEVVEIIAVAGINIFINYFNHIAGTEIDFPVVRSASAS